MGTGYRFKTLQELQATSGLHVEMGKMYTNCFDLSKSRKFLGSVNIRDLGNEISELERDDFCSASFFAVVSVKIDDDKPKTKETEPVKEEAKISMDKKYKTKNGKNVRILCTDGNGDCKVWGMIEGHVLCSYWNEYGNSGEADNWLFEVKPTIKVEFWVYAFANGSYGDVHTTKPNYDDFEFCETPVALIHFEKEVEEGEGL